jgi:predicted Zn-dependent peptidase
MVANLRSWWFEQKLYSLQEVRDRIDQVTVEQVLGLGQQLGIVHNLTGVALGPRSEEELFGSLLAQL